MVLSKGHCANVQAVNHQDVLYVFGGQDTSSSANTKVFQLTDAGWAEVAGASVSDPGGCSGPTCGFRVFYPALKITEDLLHCSAR